MPLAAGQTLTHYQILAPLGAGGMGEVYRARDTRLEREVAIKVLPQDLADDPDRFLRFEREAKTLASLNHPNVGGIHGVDTEGDVYFLALELVPGEDLAARLARGPLGVEEAIDVCRQIAEGLEAAHEAGVVHRDLKPANVRVTPEGLVKILDFGLAKPIRPKASREGTTTAESDSFLMTEEGLVLGTPTYMSPEQARGKPVDRRTDIWAFGCVMYECLTGKRAFRGDSLTDVLAAIVGEEPDPSLLPPVPAKVRGLLSRCLEKDPRVRLRDIGEARVLLQSGDLEGETQAVAPAKATGSRAALLVLGGAILGAAIGGAVLDRGGAASEGGAERRGEPPPIRRFAQAPALDEAGESVDWKSAHLSPDGKTLAAATAEGLVVRSLDSLESTRIPVQVRWGSLSWSPDSESIAYVDGNEIFRMTPQGQRKVQLYSEPDDDYRPMGLAWLDDGRIVFGVFGPRGCRLRSIPEGGGPVTEIAVVSENLIDGHLHGITAVPGGGFLAVLHDLLEDDSYSVLTEGESGVRTLHSLPGGSEDRAMAQWVPGDYLLYSHASGEEDETWAVKLSMEPLEVAGEPFFVQSGLIGASVSRDGTLAYVEQAQGLEYQLAWWSPAGGTEPIGRAHDQRIFHAHLAQELSSVLYTVGTGPQMDIWSHDLRRDVSVELATGAEGGMLPVGIPEGRIAFSTLEVVDGEMGFRSFLLRGGAGGEFERWLEGAVMAATGTHALVMDVGSGEQTDFFVADLATGARRDFYVGKGEYSSVQLSPDGGLVLLASGGWSSGSGAVLKRFPDGDGEWQVTGDRVWSVAFAPDASAIYYVGEGRQVHRVSLRTEPELVLGTPEVVGQVEEGTTLSGGVEASSGRFLATRKQGSLEGDLVVVLGWAAELAGR